MVPADSLSYHVVYDVRHGLPQGWWGFLFPLGIAVVLLRFAPRATFKGARVFLKFFKGFAVFLTLAFIGGTVFTSVHLRRALAHGDVRIVEGIVTDFIPEKSMEKRPEQFVVMTPTARYKYRYSSSFGEGGMNKSKGHIQNGLRVRVADFDGVIVRLEVAHDASGNTLTPELAGRFPKVSFLPKVHVGYGKTATIPETKGMAIRFVDVVSDTRHLVHHVPCSNCSKSGDAVAIFEMFDTEVGKEPFRFEVHTNRELYPPFTDGDLVVDLIFLIPVPDEGHPFVKSDYIATLMIGRRQTAHSD